MRDFFINSFEKLVGIIVILMAIGVVLFAGAALMGAGGQGGPGGIFGALIVLVVGAVYIIFIGGAMYLGLGIYQNTKRMADAMERQSGG